MYANLPFLKKLPLFWGIIPVYFVIFKVTFTITYYIIFDSKYTNSFLKILSLIIFEPLALLTFITHLLSMFKNPGYVPIPYKPQTNYFEINSNSSVNTDNNTNNGLLQDRNDLFCKKCNNPRPLRSHHCKICGKCTLKMDHHCHWIANCVGYYNQKNFYQFLFYSTLGDLIGFFLLLIRFFSCNLNIKDNIPSDVKIKSPLTLIYYLWEPINIMIAILCSFAMTISIGTLFYKQTWMLLLNQTTIDKKLFEDWNNSPYYNENQSKNFKSVMGESFCDWFSLRFEGNDPYNYSKKKKYYNLDNIESEI
jgi:hypothetical protein